MSAHISPCPNCTPAELFQSAVMNEDEWARTHGVIVTRRAVKKGALLYHCGQAFDYLCAVRTGAFKSSTIAESNEETVIGFHLPGELLGSDGLLRKRHEVEVRALVDSDVCVISASEVLQLMEDVAPVKQFFFQNVTDEVHRMRRFLLLLNQRGAEQRLATFLLNFAKRLHKRGYSPTDMVLPMGRADIASYLGLKQETVSRSFALLSEYGYIAVDNRDIRILQHDALRQFRTKRLA